jgi:HK97 family phage major capsid protein
MKKPTPDEIAQLRATYPEGTPRIGYRVATIQRAAAAAEDPEEAADETPQDANEEDAERNAAAADTAPIPIALSSEQPVLRYDWWTDETYYEVLDHSPRSIDLSYATDGLPFLDAHQSYSAEKMHGLIENVKVGKDRVLRGMLRMSRAPESQRIAMDIRDGLRKKVSVGYIVGEEFTQEKTAGSEYPTRRYTNWMPVEGSTVPVPADYTVGIGRAQSVEGRAALSRFLELHPAARTTPQAPTGKEQHMPPVNPAPDGANENAQTTAVDVQVIERQANERAQSRIANLTAIATQHGFQDRLSSWIGENRSELDVVKEVNVALAERLKEQEKKPIPSARGVELTERDYQRFNYARAMLQDEQLHEMWRKDPVDGGKKIDLGFEREVIQEALRNAPADRKGGIYIPFITTKERTEMSRGERAIDSLTSTTGSPFKFTQAGDFIQLLRNKSSVLRCGVTTFTGLTGPLTFPKQTAAGTASWRAENPGSDITRADLTTSTVSLSFKTVQAAMAVSRQVLFSAASGNYDLEQFVRNDLAAIVGLAIDLAGLNGLGSTNQPLGLLQDTNVGTATALGTAGGTIAWNNIVDLEAAVGNANADVGSMTYLTNTRQRAQAKKKAVLDATQSGVPIWGGNLMSQGSQATPQFQQDGIVNGYRAIASNQVPFNLTKGTNTTVCSAWVFGAFEHLLMGLFGNGFEVIVDPYTLKLQNLIDLTAWSFVDFANRYPVAFATLKDAL